MDYDEKVRFSNSSANLVIFADCCDFAWRRPDRKSASWSSNTAGSASEPGQKCEQSHSLSCFDMVFADKVRRVSSSLHCAAWAASTRPPALLRLSRKLPTRVRGEVCLGGTNVCRKSRMEAHAGVKGGFQTHRAFMWRPVRIERQHARVWWGPTTADPLPWTPHLQLHMHATGGPSSVTLSSLLITRLSVLLALSSFLPTTLTLVYSPCQNHTLFSFPLRRSWIR